MVEKKKRKKKDDIPPAEGEAETLVAVETADGPAEVVVAEAEEAVVEEVAVVEEEEKKLSPLEKVAALTGGLIRNDIPDFRPGDTVRVHVKIVESNKERIQAFEGVVIALKHGGLDRTFTVRKTSWGVGVERTFFINSTKIDKIELVRKGRVRRAKLYYLRGRAGKSARIKERRLTRE